MNQQDIDKLRKKMDLNWEEYYILDKASLVVRGIYKECDSLDLCMTKEALQKIKEKNIFLVEERATSQLDSEYRIGNQINIFLKEKQSFQSEIVEKYPLELVEVVEQRAKEKGMEEEVLAIEKYLQNMKYEVCCGGYVIDNGKVLLVQHNEGHWDFPKGHMEAGEKEEETAIREVWEETGIAIEIVSSKRYEINYKSKMNIQKKVIFFEAKKIDGTLRNQESEIQNVEWVPIEKAFEKITYERSRIRFQKFMNEKRGV